MIFDADDVYEIEESYKEEIDKLKQCYCNRTDCGARIKDSKKYDSLQQRIDKAIEYIENQWYSKNTTDIDNVISLGNWKLDLLSILRGYDNE